MSVGPVFFLSPMPHASFDDIAEMFGVVAGVHIGDAMRAAVESIVDVNADDVLNCDWSLTWDGWEALAVDLLLCDDGSAVAIETMFLKVGQALRRFLLKLLLAMSTYHFYLTETVCDNYWISVSHMGVV